MSTVFILDHLHTQEDGEEDWKRIGIYSSRENAMAAISRASKLPGFDKYPDLIDHSNPECKHGFNIDEIVIDADSWETGFVTIT